MFNFLHGDNHQEKEAFNTTTFGWCGQVCLGANQIPGFFDHQHLWKEIIPLFDYCQSFRYHEMHIMIPALFQPQKINQASIF